MIRPQATKQKKHVELLNNLKKGDRVITKGGIIGTIHNIKGKNKEILELDINNTKIDILKSHINSTYSK